MCLRETVGFLFVSWSFFCQFVKVIGCWGELSSFSSVGRFFFFACGLVLSQAAMFIGGFYGEGSDEREKDKALLILCVLLVCCIDSPLISLFSHLNQDLNMVSNECTVIRSLCSAIDSRINEVIEERSLHCHAQNRPINFRINRVKEDQK